MDPKRGGYKEGRSLCAWAKKTISLKTRKGAELSSTDFVSTISRYYTFATTLRSGGQAEIWTPFETITVAKQMCKSAWCFDSPYKLLHYRSNLILVCVGNTSSRERLHRKFSRKQVLRTFFNRAKRLFPCINRWSLKWGNYLGKMAPFQTAMKIAHKESTC